MPFMSPRGKERDTRVEFLLRTAEQKKLLKLKLDEQKMTRTDFFNKYVDNLLAVESDDSPIDPMLHKRLRELEEENDRLRAAFSIKAGALSNLKEEVRSIRADTLGELNVEEALELSKQIERFIKSQGRVSRRQLISSIEDSFKINEITRILMMVEQRLVREGHVVIIEGGDLQWIA